MDWLNLHASIMDSPEFVGSGTRERGVWLSLLRYCIGQENAGRIESSRLWKDRQWQQLARVTAREVATDCRLYWWTGDTLVLWGYPSDKEGEVIRRREAARANGKTGGRPRINNPEITNVGYLSKPTSVISGKAEREWKGKGKEKENTEARAEPDADLPLVDSVVLFPDPLDTPHFREAWAEWTAYRRERRIAALKPRSVIAQLAKLAAWGHDGAIDSIRESIAQNYQGLFPPRTASGRPEKTAGWNTP